MLFSWVLGEWDVFIRLVVIFLMHDNGIFFKKVRGFVYSEQLFKLLTKSVSKKETNVCVGKHIRIIGHNMSFESLFVCSCDDWNWWIFPPSLLLSEQSSSSD